MKHFFAALLVLFSFSWSDTVTAQQNNPLLQSGILMEQASQLYDSAAYKKSREIYRKIDYNDTNYVRALYGMSLCYYADSQYNESMRCCEKALSLTIDREKEPDLFNQYGNSIDAAGNPERALRVYDSALQKYPAYSLLALNKGNVLLKLKRYAEAEAVFKQALLQDPYSYSSHYKLAACALYQGKLIPAFLGLVGYLLMYPEGRYSTNAINLLSSISKNEDEIQQYVNNRKEAPGESYQLLEQILQSKIALDENYKPIIQLDDKISRQIQVVFEKMEYQESDSDFWMQYYIPFFKSIYTGNQFEYFINHIFSGVNIKPIVDYNKKHKKEIDALKSQASDYFDLVRGSRELSYGKRKTDSLWSYSKGELTGHGIFLEKADKLSGYWEFYFAPGNIKSKGTYDEMGKKTGPWTYYYFNGAVKGKEIYRGGKQEDEETYYYSNGAVASHSSYKNNLPEGESKSYFWIGSLRSITHYQEGKEEGVKIGLRSNGDSSYMETYSAGELNGLAKTWFENGHPEIICQYTKGKLDGPYKKYYSNGQLSMTGEYRMGKQEGSWKFYHPNGQLKDDQNFVNDKQEGEYKEYHDNGKLHITYTSRKGKVNGEARYYDDDEKLYAIYQFDNDLLKKTQFFDKSGKQISESSMQQKKITVTGFLPDASKRQVMSYSEKGNISGTETFYYPSGKVMETDEYEEGQEQGPSIAYYLNGQKKSETAYADGKMDGYHQTFYVDGKVQEEGWYKENTMQGTWLTYNDLGLLTDSVYYSDGDIDGLKGSYLPNGRKEFGWKYHSGWMESWEQYDSTGRKLTDFHFTGGSGKVSVVYPDGKPYLQATYYHNKLQGPRNFYYCDGKLLASEYYKKGRQDSLYKAYYHSGLVKIEGQFRDGDKTGLWKYYTKEGKISTTEEYVDGKLNGKQVSYLDNGKIDRETQYKDEEKNGISKKTDLNGQLLYQIVFKNDKAVGYSYLDKNNTLVPEIPIIQGAAKVKTFYANGNVSAEFEYQDGLLNGMSKQYYANGQLNIVCQFEGGNWEGSYKIYHANGKLKTEFLYFHDNLHGPYKEYNEKGILTEEGTYYLGSPHGTTRIYDDQGKLKETDFYYYGKLLSYKNEAKP